MNIVMTGLDHHTAPLAVREAFALGEADVGALLQTLRAGTGVLGCAVLSTCNRTEVYFSHKAGAAPDPAALLCGALKLDEKEYGRYFKTRSGREAALYLFEVAAGLHSQILGEDQILTQVRSSIEGARAAHCADPVLETLFRTAVTAGKQVKTRVKFFRRGGSVALGAAEKLEQWWPTAPGKALVIGNGTVGRLMAEELLCRGWEVTATLRRYHHGRPEMPDGCLVVEYDGRYSAMPGCDVVVSATASPHHTVKAEAVAALEKHPALFIDLAVPRDIEPEVANLTGSALWNVDSLGGGGEDDNAEALAEAGEILQEQLARFEQWQQNREAGPGAAKAPAATEIHYKEVLPEEMRPVEKPQAGPAPAQQPDSPANFPAFISLQGQRVVVAGGGNIATRRVGVLQRFGARVRVVSPSLSETLAALAEEGRIEWEPRPYRPGDLAGALLVVAATSSREANAQIGREAKRQGILVSVADCQEECSFYFPAIVQSPGLTAGIVSNHGDHALVRRTAATLRERLEEIENEDTRRQP